MVQVSIFKHLCFYLLLKIFLQYRLCWSAVTFIVFSTSERHFLKPLFVSFCKLSHLFRILRTFTLKCELKQLYIVNNDTEVQKCQVINSCALYPAPSFRKRKSSRNLSQRKYTKFVPLNLKTACSSHETRQKPLYFRMRIPSEEHIWRSLLSITAKN